MYVKVGPQKRLSTKELMSPIVVLENNLEGPFSKEIKPVNPKGNQPWIFIGRFDAETEAPILWPPDANIWLIGKDSDAGEDWREKEKRAAEDEMDMDLSKLLEIVKDREAWCATLNGFPKSKTWLRDWTTTIVCLTFALSKWHEIFGRKNINNFGKYCTVIFF